MISKDIASQFSVTKYLFAGRGAQRFLPLCSAPPEDNLLDYAIAVRFIMKLIDRNNQYYAHIHLSSRPQIDQANVTAVGFFLWQRLIFGPRRPLWCSHSRSALKEGNKTGWLGETYHRTLPNNGFFHLGLVELLALNDRIDFYARVIQIFDLAFLCNEHAGIWLKQNRLVQ